MASLCLWGLLAVTAPSASGIGSPQNDQAAQVRPAQPRPTATPARAGSEQNSADPVDRPPAEPQESSIITKPQDPTRLVLPAAPLDEEAKFARFDKLGEPGLTSGFPGTADTLIRDLGGIRSWLADRDISFQIRDLTIGYLRLSDTGQPRNPERYQGQRTNFSSNTATGTVTIGLGRFGLTDTSLTASAVSYITTFRPNGGDTLRLRTLYLYHSALGGKLEMKAGYLDNIFEYAGLFTGGSPVLTSGLGGLIPVQGGLTADPIATPGANVTLHIKGGAYVKGGVQRSSSPYGRLAEVEANHSGFDIGVPGARLMTLGEVGWRRKATADEKQFWLRMGGIYNGSHYNRFDGRGTSHNQVFYVAGDRQLWRKEGAKPATGVYAGLSFFYAPAAVNIFAKNVEARLYATGLWSLRPSDTISFKANYNDFGNPAVRSARNSGLHANSQQLSLELDYSAHLHNGVYALPSVSYVIHPSYIGDYKPAWIFSLNLTTLY